VSNGELSDIWNLAKWAPSAANMRPGRGRDRLVKHMNDCNKTKTASAASAAVLAVDTRFHELLALRPEIKDVFERGEEMRAGTGTFNASLQAGLQTGGQYRPAGSGSVVRTPSAPRPRGRASLLKMGSPWLDHHPCVPALSEPKKDLTFRTAAASSSSRKKVST